MSSMHVALPPRPLYASMALCLGTGSSFVIGPCLWKAKIAVIRWQQYRRAQERL